MSKALISLIGLPNLHRLDWLRWNRLEENIMLGNLGLNQDFKEFLQSLNDNNVRYLIIGGYAVAMHGYPRYTKDIDIWIDLEEQNAINMVKALDAFGFSSLNLHKEDFLEPDTVIQLGYPPARIDVLVGLEGTTFEECYKTRIEETIDGVRINFIDRKNLIILKRSAGRPQDLADIDRLENT